MKVNALSLIGCWAWMAMAPMASHATNAADGTADKTMMKDAPHPHDSIPRHFRARNLHSLSSSSSSPASMLSPSSSSIRGHKGHVVQQRNLPSTLDEGDTVSEVVPKMNTKKVEKGKKPTTKKRKAHHNDIVAGGHINFNFMENEIGNISNDFNFIGCGGENNPLLSQNEQGNEEEEVDDRRRRSLVMMDEAYVGRWKMDAPHDQLQQHKDLMGAWIEEKLDSLIQKRLEPLQKQINLIVDLLQQQQQQEKQLHE